MALGFAVEETIDDLGDIAANPVDLFQVMQAGPRHFSRRPEMMEQGAFTPGADAWYLVKR